MVTTNDVQIDAVSNGESDVFCVSDSICQFWKGLLVSFKNYRRKTLLIPTVRRTGIGSGKNPGGGKHSTATSTCMANPTCSARTVLPSQNATKARVPRATHLPWKACLAIHVLSAMTSMALTPPSLMIPLSMTAIPLVAKPTLAMSLRALTQTRCDTHPRSPWFLIPPCTARLASLLPSWMSVEVDLLLLAHTRGRGHEQARIRE